MSSSRLLSPLYLLSLSLVLQLALGDTPLGYTCFDSGNFTSSDLYNQNLDNLLGLLDLKTPQCGFDSETVGQYQDLSYGLALCRGDVNAIACQACVDEATKEIQNLCPNKKAAAIWYDFCQVKYSNVNFMGLVNNQVTVVLTNTASASNPDYFNGKVIQLIGELKEEASASPMLYAAGALDIGYSITIYGQVQCTRDLSGTSCVECIDFATKVIVQDAYGKLGARFLGESCDVRFEIYPFVFA